MKPTHFPTRAHLLVCTGPKCEARGSKALFAALWSDLEREGLAYYARGGSVRLTESGCLGACSFGPNATCYRRNADGALEEAWYYEQDRTSLGRLAVALHRGDPLPDDDRYDRPPVR